MIKLGDNEGISDLYYNDSWFKSLVMEIADFYGYPISTEDAISTGEQVMCTYATVNISLGLEQFLDEWYSWWEDKVPVTPLMAELFCRKYYKQMGDHIL